MIPVRDEARTVGAALESLAAQTIGAGALEVLVYDGGSSDGTADVCRSFAGAHPWGRFEVFDNPAGTVPHALNAGLSDGQSQWFTVLAGRTTFSPDYLEACLAELEGAGSGVAVGGRFVADVRDGTAGAIAAVVTHRLGVGRGFRTETRAGELSHHPFAVWRRDDVVRYGGFDESLVRNQDDEFCMRATRLGARIRLLPGPEVRYRPRERFRGLAVQYFQYGLWKSAVGLRTGLFPRRSLAPAVAAAAVGVTLPLAACGRSRAPFAAVAAAYVVAGSVVAAERGSSRILTTGALALLHLSYGAGVIAGAVRPRLASSPLGRTRLR